MLATDAADIWLKINSTLGGVKETFFDMWSQTQCHFSVGGLNEYAVKAAEISQWGRGPEPVLAWLRLAPQLMDSNGATPELFWPVVQAMQKSSNSRHVSTLFASLGQLYPRLQSVELRCQYLNIVQSLMVQTTVSIHGRQTLEPSPAVADFLFAAPRLLTLFSIENLEKWVVFGVQTCEQRPDYLKAYFALESLESQQYLRTLRPGLCLDQVIRPATMLVLAMWQIKPVLNALTIDDDSVLIPNRRALSVDGNGQYTFSHKSVLAYSESQAAVFQQPAMQVDLWGLPERLIDLPHVLAWQRYVLMLTHLAAHHCWSTAMIADNWSPIQRLTVEWFEDIRVDYLTCQKWPGLRLLMQRIHPNAKSTHCNQNLFSCVRHRLAVFSAAVLWADPSRLPNDVQKKLYEAFIEACAKPSQTSVIAQLALRFATQTHHVNDQKSVVFFDNTMIDWRDDNRHLWQFIEEGDEEDTAPSLSKTVQDDFSELPPQYYPEWDDTLKLERPNWVKVYARLHPIGQAELIDQMLTKHHVLMKKLRKVVDAFKPQNRRRERFLEQGTELDWDVALQAFVDFKSGHTPSLKIEQHHVHADRDIAVHVLMDLSASLNDKLGKSQQSVLKMSQTAVALLAWVMQSLGDTFAISGFNSNTRHQVRFLHIKGFNESWQASVWGRLAAIEPAYSTRLGAAIRHAGSSLRVRPEAKRLLLVLTDGEPSDLDVASPQYLVADAHHAVAQLKEQGIFTWCMHLETKSQEAVRQVFGHQVTILNRVERLPEALTNLFLNLTKS